MKRIILSGLLILATATYASAIPTLQVGALKGTGDLGTYADYKSTLSNPTETDTAVAVGGVNGSTLVAVGSYGSNANQKPHLLGGQYLTGENWSSFGFNTSFDTAGAVIMATVPQTNFDAGGYTLLVGGNAAFFTTTGFGSGFNMPTPPANHDPVKDSSPDKAYLFFNIGNFAFNLGPVFNLADESGSDLFGETKLLDLEVEGFDWVHFDLMALLTDTQGQTNLRTTLAGNPGSHDLTWKPGDNGGPDPDAVVPEPSTIILLGAGLLGLGLANRRKFKR